MDHMYFARLDLSEGYWQVPFCSSFGSFSDPLSLYSSLYAFWVGQSNFFFLLRMRCFKMFQMLIDIILVFTDNKFFWSTCFWAFWSFTATLLGTTHCKSNEVFIGVSKEWMSGAYCDKIHPDPDKVLVIHQQTILRLKRSCDCFKDWQIFSENHFQFRSYSFYLNRCHEEVFFRAKCSGVNLKKGVSKF